MISISKKNVSKITKIGSLLFIIYIVGFAFFKLANYYKTYMEKEKLTQELQIKKNETNSVKKRIEINNKRIEDLKNSYITKEEIDNKVKDIFDRMSIFDYNLKFIDSKMMCIDRYILVAQLTSQSENGLKAGEGILSYIGEIKQSEKNNSIYFINYRTYPKVVHQEVEQEAKQ